MIRGLTAVENANLLHLNFALLCLQTNMFLGEKHLFSHLIYFKYQTICIDDVSFEKEISD